MSEAIEKLKVLARYIRATRPVVSHEISIIVADLEAERARMLEPIERSLQEVGPIVEFYLKREIESPANHQEFAREAQEKLDRFRQLEVALREAKERANG